MIAKENKALRLTLREDYYQFLEERSKESGLTKSIYVQEILRREKNADEKSKQRV